MSSAQGKKRVWERVREAICTALHAVLGPAPPEVVEKVEDVLGRTKRHRNDKEERRQCQDEANDKL